MLNFRNEWSKLIHKRSTIVLFCLSAIFPLITGPIIQMMQNRFGFTAFDGESFPLVILGLAVSIYLPLILALGISDMFTGEQEQKTLSFILVRPLSRFKIFVSKIACSCIYLLSLLMIVFISSMLTGAIWLENFTLHGLVLGFFAYLLSLLPLMAIGLMLVFLALWFGASSRAITFSILLYLVMMAISYLFPTIAQWLPIYDNSWYQRWINSGVSVVTLGRTLYLLSFCTLFFTLGYYKFTTKEY
ncbi:ABC transporter permease [Bacillus sp. UNC438CL73TsuS30]|uniref:ABC transporter permease n=1 Tax=Bacillus sp. UNC438CL73TsuS30 TaxID=1340434 RepID=UPI00047BB5C1|nr:ABC transporter permease [Bacillus sp. UNC438CL73TsuS30]